MLAEASGEPAGRSPCHLVFDAGLLAGDHQLRSDRADVGGPRGARRRHGARRRQRPDRRAPAQRGQLRARRRAEGARARWASARRRCRDRLKPCPNPNHHPNHHPNHPPNHHPKPKPNPDGETDWKLLVIDIDAADAPSWRDVSDIPVERVNEVRGWYRMHKAYSTLLYSTLHALLCLLYLLYSTLPTTYYLLGARVVPHVQDRRGKGRE